jgi:hypothetical protein
MLPSIPRFSKSLLSSGLWTRNLNAFLFFYALYLSRQLKLLNLNILIMFSLKYELWTLGITHVDALRKELNEETCGFDEVFTTF